ncbi:hypothetical protein Tco_0178395 [Tanacetum coccineum]
MVTPANAGPRRQNADRVLSWQASLLRDFTMACAYMVPIGGYRRRRVCLDDAPLSFRCGCLDRLRSNQMKDVEKLRLLNGLVVDSEAVVREKEEYAIDIDGY